MSAKYAEAQVWEKLYEFVMNPAFLLAQAKHLVHQIQQKYEYLQKVQRQVLGELKELAVESQRFITHARKELMNNVDFAEQIGR